MPLSQVATLTPVWEPTSLMSARLIASMGPVVVAFFAALLLMGWAVALGCAVGWPIGIWLGHERHAGERQGRHAVRPANSFSAAETTMLGEIPVRQRKSPGTQWR